MRRGKVVLLVATGVRWDGGFEVLDWEGCSGESSLGYERLLDRLYSRGLEEVEVIVGDEACGIWEAVDVVYPYSRRQVCLWHLERTLEGGCYRGGIFGLGGGLGGRIGVFLMWTILMRPGGGLIGF